MIMTLYHGTDCIFDHIDLNKSSLKYSRLNDQVSFHTEKALESLKFVRRYIVE